jgi:hypothetical protein
MAMNNNKLVAVVRASDQSSTSFHAEEWNGVRELLGGWEGVMFLLYEWKGRAWRVVLYILLSPNVAR